MARRAVTIKLDTLPSKDQKLINKWLDAQYNQQLSLATLLMHAINQLEVKDIMSFEMQRLLHTQGLHSVLTQSEHHTGASIAPVIPIETQPSETNNSNKPEQADEPEPIVETPKPDVTEVPPVIEDVVKPEPSNEPIIAEPEQHTETPVPVKKGTIDEHADPTKIAPVNPNVYDQF